MWTRCRDSSTPRPGASIRVSIRPGPPRDGSPPPTRTCRTSPCVPRAARPSAAPSSLRPAPCSSRPTIPKSSCASWPISHATRRSSKPSSRAGTFIAGRRRYIPELKDRNYNIRAFGERTATNSPLQGSAADLIKIAMIRIAGALKQQGLGSRMILQVHDELVVEVPRGEEEVATELVKRHMERAADLRVPLVVRVGMGTNWVDAKG